MRFIVKASAEGSAKMFIQRPLCSRRNVKLPAHGAGLPGNVVSFCIVPLYPAYKAGLAGHVPVNFPLIPSLRMMINKMPLKVNLALQRFTPMVSVEIRLEIIYVGNN
jgi:hypothetical protein